MNKYEIQSGEISGIFEGETHEVAFKRAIELFYHKTKKYPKLGLLMRFREIEITGELVKKSRKNDLGKRKYQNPLVILNPKPKDKK